MINLFSASSFVILLGFSAISPTVLAISGNVTNMELSHDNGIPYSAAHMSLIYSAQEYRQPPEGIWYLNAIKYYVNQTWPDTIFQGFGVACWKMEGGTPGIIVWPADGVPVYNQGEGGGWIIQQVEPKLNLYQVCPDGFAVGVAYLYHFPDCDSLGRDSPLSGPYAWDWLAWWDQSLWNWMIRCYIDDEGYADVETETIGQIRAIYR